MPERDLPEHLRARLSSELTSGAPLSAPLPSQARYSRLVTQVPGGSSRWRLAAAAAAALALVSIATAAGQPQARAWIGQSAGNIVRTVEHSGPRTASPSPVKTPDGPHPGARPTPHESPEPSGSGETPEPAQSPESHETPKATPSPDGDEQAPSPRPSSGGDGEGSSSGGAPSPTPDGSTSGDGH